MLGVSSILLLSLLSPIFAGVVIQTPSPTEISHLSSENCPPSLLLIGPPGDQMTYAEDFLKSLIPSLMEEVSISYFRIADLEKYPGFAGIISPRDVPVQFILKRQKIVRHFGGKLKHTDLVKFIRLNIEEYSYQLGDSNFDTFTGVYTWESEKDWLIQFYNAKKYPRDLWNDVGYRLIGFSSVAHLNVTESPYTAERLSELLHNATLPAAIFFRNRTMYLYRGKVAASNFVEFLRDFFYNPKNYHKLMFAAGPTPYNIPAPPHLYLRVWDYLFTPEIYNTLILLAVFGIISVVRYKMRKLDEEEKKLKKLLETSS